MGLADDPRVAEYRTAARDVHLGLSAPEGAGERYRQSLLPYVEHHAEAVDALLAEGRTHPRMRELLMRSLFENGLPLGVIAVGFKATEEEFEYVKADPPLKDEPVDEIDRLRRLPYRAYLRTEHWQQIRAAALKRANGCCLLCNSPQNLEVHHRTYDRRGCERPGDVAVLCDSCHSRHHGTLRAA